MKVFSLKKYIRWDKYGKGRKYVPPTKEYWASCCDGQPVINGWIKGTDGRSYASDENWEVNRKEIKNAD